jgi:hypothetical protein
MTRERYIRMVAGSFVLSGLLRAHYLASMNSPSTETPVR